MDHLSCCGTDCSACSFYGNLCKGCNECEGKVFYGEGKTCRIYECTIHEKKISGCGDCQKLPCELWRMTRDPHFTDEEFEENIRGRVENLRKCRESARDGEHRASAVGKARDGEQQASADGSARDGEHRGSVVGKARDGEMHKEEEKLRNGRSQREAGGKVMLSRADFDRIDKWMHRNARELELARWNYYFGDGDKDAILCALSFYQNEDGGFGHAVDPDNWNVNSLAYGVFYVLGLLREIEFFDFSHPVYQGINRYLEGTYPEGWVFTLPSNEQYPHASFYHYSEEYNKVESQGIIMSFSAFIIENYPGSPIYQQVLDNAVKMLGSIGESNPGDMGPVGYMSLIIAMKKAGIEDLDYELFIQRLKYVINNGMQRNPEQWAEYGMRPSDVISTKDSPFYAGNEATVEAELDYLIQTLPENDVWPLSWTWMSNSGKYPREWAISSNWSKAYKTIEHMRFLKEFGRF